MGLRARITLFTGVVLLVVVSVLLAAVSREQERLFETRVQRETSPYFLPVRKLVTETAHFQKNLIRLEEARRANDLLNARYAGKPLLKARLVFSDEYFKTAETRAKSFLPEQLEKNSDEWTALAQAAAARRGFPDFLNYAQYFENRLLMRLDFGTLYLKALTGLDRRVFRIQALDMAGNVRAIGPGADTQGISDTYNDALINQAAFRTIAPVTATYSIQADEVTASGQRFLVFTNGIARNEEIAFRGRTLMSAASARKLTAVLALDRKYSVALKQTGTQLLAREDALASEDPPRIPALDPEYKKLAESYAAILRDREDATLRALRRIPAESPESRGALEDAVQNLRGAVLDSELFIRYDYASYARGYSGREDWRIQYENRYSYLRKWLLEGGTEVYYPYAGAAEHLLYNRRSALERMVSIDTASPDELAERALAEESAGYVRIFVDPARFQEDRTQERDRILDTAVAFGLRIFFVAVLLSAFLVRRIQAIIAGARQVGVGNLSVSFESGGSDEVADLAGSLNQMVQGLREREAMRGEMSAAEEIQRRLLPDKMPGNMTESLSFGTFYKAMMGVGGDYFDLMETGPDTMVFCIADVSSHGAGPAIVMTMLRSYLRAAVRRTRDLRKIVLELNSRMFEETPSSMFITMFLGQYDRATHTIEAVNCGHNKSFVYKYSSGSIEEHNSTSLPLGAVDSDLFATAVSSQTIKLAAGDLFFQYTDGLNEGMNDAGEEFGLDRMKEILRANGRKKPVILLETLAKAAEEFTGKKIFVPGPSEQKDDIAMIAFRRIK
jgi:serine phosphatase RsbU (regulator of sigma subunit)